MLAATKYSKTLLVLFLVPRLAWLAAAQVSKTCITAKPHTLKQAASTGPAVFLRQAGGEGGGGP